jgi:DHA3 family macrolide efflux protein-like MFS transporter
LRNKKALLILFLANGISGFAQGITMLSIPWYFTGQNQFSLFNIFYALVTLGSLFWGLYAGALVDGFNRKDVFLGTNFIEGLIILSIASLGFKEFASPEVRDHALPTALIVMVFATTFFGYIIHYPNLYAFAQEISDPRDYTKVTSYIEIVGQSTVMASAALGVFLLDGVDSIETISFLGFERTFELKINKWELHEIFLMDGITYIISFVMIIFIKYEPVKNLAQFDEGDLKDRLKSGYDFLKRNTLVTIFGVCSYSIFIVLLVERIGLLSKYVNNNLQESAAVFSYSEIFYTLGSLIMGYLAAGFLSKIPIPKSIIIFVFLTSAGFFLSAFTETSLVFYLVSFVFGLANAGSRIFRISYLFMLVPNELTGRVNSMFNVITTVFRMIFILTFTLPFFSRGANIAYAYGFLGLFTLATGVVLIVLYKRLLALTENISETESAHH